MSDHDEHRITSLRSWPSESQPRKEDKELIEAYRAAISAADTAIHALTRSVEAQAATIKAQDSIIASQKKIIELKDSFIAALERMKRL